MTDQFIYTILYLAGFLGIIQLSELLYHKFKVDVEITRKIAHVLGCLSSLSFLLLFHSHWYVLVVTGTFFLLLLFSKRNGIYNSIDLVERKSIGSFILPLSVYLLFLISESTGDKLYFILPVLILGISDPLAGLAGTSYKEAKQINILVFKFQKTYIGSFAFFVTTLVLTSSTFYVFNLSGQNILISGLYFAVVVTFVEIISNRGLDNLTVPLAVAFLLWTVK